MADPTDPTTTQKYINVRTAHAVLGPIAYALLFPLGAIYIRLSLSRTSVWKHAGIMALAYTLALTAMGMGAWMATISGQIDEYHCIIGLVLIGVLLIQPITGLAHHLLYKRSGRPNAATYPHVWWGRAVITLGIINGGFGLQLTGESRAGEIVYGVLAGSVWVIWMIVIVIAFFKSRDIKDGETGDKVFGSQMKSTDAM